MISRRTGGSGLAWLVGLLLAGLAQAAVPTLDALNPSGAAIDSTNIVTLSGALDPWPPKVWIDPPGVEFIAETNSGKFRVEVAKNARPGPRLVRIYNAEGASDPRIFVVGEGREIAEVEPNNSHKTPQAIDALPVTINGQLAKNGDVDSFALDVPAGQWLDARLDSYLLMSKIDGVLRLVDTNGFQLAWNHDFVTLDPRLVWQSKAGGRVVLQVFGFAYPAGSEVVLSGGAGGFYRLHLGAGATKPAMIAEPSDEMEPNDTREQARELKPPETAVGEIGRVGDEDRFKITVTEGEFIEITLEAGQVGTLLHGVLRIEDAKGAELAKAEDAVYPNDPRIEWRAGNQGTVFVVVSSLTLAGGPEHRYRLSVRPIKPDYKIAAAAASITLQNGSTNTLKVTAQRLRGFTNQLALEVRGLPEGVAVTPLTIGEKETEVSLNFTTTTNAPPFSGPLILTAKASGVVEGERVIPFNLVATGENNGVPNGYAKLLADRVDHVWLTVKPPPPPPAPAPPAK